MSDIESRKTNEKSFNNKKHKKLLTKQNSPISLKKHKYISNHNSNLNNYINKKIKVYKPSSKLKNNKNITNEDRSNSIKERTTNNNSHNKDIKSKSLKKRNFSPRVGDNNDDNYILLQKIKNIQIQTNLMKDELKKYKYIEKNFVNKPIRKKINKYNLKIKKNLDTKRDDNNNEKLNKIIKKNNITINVIKDNKLNTNRSARKNVLNSDRIKNKNILTDYINDYFTDKNTPSIKINNNNSSKFIKFKKDKLKKFLSSKAKNERQNSAENRIKYKIKNYLLSPKYTYNITEINKSKNKSKYINDQNLSLNIKDKNISPIRKVKNKEKIVLSDTKISGTKNAIYHKKEKPNINQKINPIINIEYKNKGKLNKSNKNIRMKISKSVERMESGNQKKFHESKIKNPQDISFDYINLNNSNENAKEKIKEKEILKIEKLCKKGFSCDGADKPNQDNFFIYTNFNNDSNNIYMGICDGHGQFGHYISSFLVTNLPLVLGNFLRIFNIKDISSTDKNTLFPIVTSSFIQINKNLSLEKSIDCTLSGSTCVSLIYTSKKIFCINLGDSRCIIGKFDGKSWKSQNLSIDHKPELEKEKERILKNGGEIRKMKDDDGEFIGPQRVWVKEANYPGLAMSRSFGDDLAHQIGVICEPEIFEYELKEEDKFIIIASDGIWEFMSNQDCVDIIKDYYVNENFKGAAKHLYKESCKRWLNEEDSIDDITLIVVFFK
jgi:serine/threonine protein phosphatase PrpC